MEAIVFVLGFVALGILALRFGKDTREGLWSKEHELASHGMSWTDVVEARPMPAHQTDSFPTLAFIERALATPRALTTRPDAASLEVRARSLTAAYWSDHAWLTGVVPEPACRRVLAELDPTLAGAAVVEVEPTTDDAGPVDQPGPAAVSEHHPTVALASSAASA
jgi:hypothetical protein